MAEPPRPPLHVVVVTKAPDALRSKTRLHPLPGPERVALAEAMILDTLDLCAALPGARVWVAGDPPDAPFFTTLAATRPVGIHPQGDGDLGARLRRISAALQADGAPLLFLGSDSPHLPPSMLHAAAEALHTHAACLIPAEDGGYVLLGLTHPAPSLFEDIPWSTPAVAETTRRRAAEAGLSLAELPPFWDLDTPADLRRLRAEPGPTAPRTRARLAGALYTPGPSDLG